MAYTTRDKKAIAAREEWNLRPIDFETHLTAEQIRSYGGSQRYGRGGRWLDQHFYISIGGYKSKGGIPSKLKTSDDVIPISPTDVKELQSINAFRTM
ncbi:hypothetical protein [Methanosarcina sp. MTP4]|uniref:hypothetical protein n=1 Tax=Methanosarcina sp. MTP4 TaxID=1434100 RepID=UPI00064E9BB0|nr:hypothetical protein [Methanosarcina sp. MTP4]